MRLFPMEFGQMSLRVNSSKHTLMCGVTPVPPVGHSQGLPALGSNGRSWMKTPYKRRGVDAIWLSLSRSHAHPPSTTVGPEGVQVAFLLVVLICPIYARISVIISLTLLSPTPQQVTQLSC